MALNDKIKKSYNLRRRTMCLIKDLSSMPDIEDLHRICKGIAALEIVMCQDHRYRYYFYNSNWGDNKEIFQLINGCGSVRSGCNSNMMILFCSDGCVINGFDNCSYDDEIYYTFDDDGCIQWHKQNDKEKENILKMKEIVQGLPDVFQEFIKKSLESIRTTFCIWKTKDGKWSRSNMVGTQKDGSAEMLDILDKNPQKYVDFCQWYYQKSIPVDLVEKVYNGEALTLEMIQRLNSKIEDLSSVKDELNKMGYPHTL